MALQSILVVEDDQDMRDMIVRKLRSDAISSEIHEAGDPIKALEFFNNYKDSIGTIICDQYMPIDNGLQLCEIIRKERPSIKIIIFTGDKDICSNMDVSAVDVVLYKPEGITQLSNFIEK